MRRRKNPFKYLQLDKGIMGNKGLFLESYSSRVLGGRSLGIELSVQPRYKLEPRKYASCREEEGI